MIFNVTNGQANALPVLDENYPKDAAADYTTVRKGSATFHVVIAEQGRPAEYTYQWYVDGAPVNGATGSSFTKPDLQETKTYQIYCEVTNKAGTVQSRVATLTVTQQILYLYDHGDQNTAVTGGLKNYAYRPSGSGSAAKTGATFNATTIKLASGSGDTATATALFTERPIDLTDYSIMEINVTQQYVKYANGISMCASKNKSDYFPIAAKVYISGTGKFSVNIASLSGDYYPVISLAGSGAKEVTFDSWSLK